MFVNFPWNMIFGRHRDHTTYRTAVTAGEPTAVERLPRTRGFTNRRWMFQGFGNFKYT